MIIQHTTDKSQVLFVPEDLRERKALDSFPGLLRHGLQFYCPSKHHIVYNIYSRLKRRFKNLKYTKDIQMMIEGEIEIKQIPDWFHFHTKPLKHQLIALRFAYTFGSFLNLSEPGLGKTKVTLDYIWLMQFKKSLIVCPMALRFVWEDERLRHRPELKVYVIETTEWTKEHPHVMMADVVVVNYDKAVILEEPLKALGFDFIAVDEGLIKDPRTDRTQSLTRLRDRIDYRSIMSGTLVNNSPLDVFAPLRFIEPSLVGESFYKFKEAHAVTKKLKDNKGSIVVAYRNVGEIKELLACCGIIMTKAEWLKDLPPKQFIHKYVQMGDKQRDYYQRLASNYLLQLPEYDLEIEVDNPLSVLCKLNQISNGFIYYHENIEETLNDLYGTEGKKRPKADRKTIIFEEQPKAQALLRLIQSEEFNNPDDEISAGGLPGSSESASPNRGPSLDGLGSSSASASSSNDGRRSSERTSSELEPDAGPSPGQAVGCVPTESAECGSGDVRIGLHNQTPNSTSACQCYSSGGKQSTTDRGERSVQSDESSSNPGPIGGRPADILGSSVSVFPRKENTGRVDPCSPAEIERARNGHSRNGTGTPLRRAIIWYNLAAERTIIETCLGNAGVPFLTVAGGTKNIGDIVRRFNTDPSVRFLLCQAKTINYGVTIMGTKEADVEDLLLPFDPQVSDEIFYSLNFSLEVFLQQQDRIHRIGQTRKCRYWLLLTNSKVERGIADRLEEKLICNKEILVDILNSLDKNLLEA